MGMACRVQFSPWVTLQTTVGVTVKGAEVTDVYGKTFPTYTNTSTIDHRYPCHTACPLHTIQMIHHTSILFCQLLHYSIHGDVKARTNLLCCVQVCCQIRHHW